MGIMLAFYPLFSSRFTSHRTACVRHKAKDGLSASSTAASAELAAANTKLEEVSAALVAAESLSNLYSAQMSESVVREAELQGAIDALNARGDADSSNSTSIIQDLRLKLEAAASAVKQSEIKMDEMAAERARLVSSIESGGERRKGELEITKIEYEAQLKTKDKELQVYISQIRTAATTLESVELRAGKDRADAELANEALVWCSFCNRSVFVLKTMFWCSHVHWHEINMRAIECGMPQLLPRFFSCP
jgi:hypothetical protein